MVTSKQSLQKLAEGVAKTKRDINLNSPKKRASTFDKVMEGVLKRTKKAQE